MSVDDFAKKPSFDSIVNSAIGFGDQKVWPKVKSNDPSLLCRDLFSYALALCEAKKMCRVPVLLERAQQMQNLSEESATYGNFWWQWGDGYVKDDNAVEFCVRAGSVLWLRHRDLLGADAQLLHEMLIPAVNACRHHASMPLYTNITLMNAMNLMLLGQGLEIQDLVELAQHRLDRFCMYTWNWGIHEFCSSTYTPIHVSCLDMIERFSDSNDMRDQARCVLKLLWSEIAESWLDKSRYLGGTQSRMSGTFLQGDVNMDQMLWTAGVPELSGMMPVIPPTLNVIFHAYSDWLITQLDLLLRRKMEIYGWPQAKGSVVLTEKPGPPMGCRLSWLLLANLG